MLRITACTVPLAVMLCIVLQATPVMMEEEAVDVKYILFDVNPGEGFNLRRDVSMRMMIMLAQLNRERGPKQRYVLVLPPWGRLYHWQSRQLGEQVKIPWEQFFDTESIKRFVPTMELEEFLDLEGPVIDSVVYLQRYAEGWKDGKFEEKMDYRDCIDEPRYRPGADGNYHGWFFSYEHMRTREFKCLSVQGHTSTIKNHVADLPGRSIFVDRAESVMHDRFGNAEYWSARRSMRFSKKLVKVANEFRKAQLKSDDKKDNTELPEAWEAHRPDRSANRGGPYLCIHLRRKDYVHSRKGQIPGLAGAADQISAKLDKLGLKSVFISTDAPLEEYEEVKKLTEAMEGKNYKVTKFIPSQDQLEEYKDGGVAVIDQSICSHAKHFVGSKESTFSFRIQEEREIMGFELDATFDMLCPDGEFDCEKGSKWKIEYPAVKDEL